MMPRVHKRRPTVLMPHWDVRVAQLLTKRNYKVLGAASTDRPDMVLFTDGPPVMPVFYGEARLGVGVPSSLARDRSDIACYRQQLHKTPKLGIGRGAHFLNIMNGGSAWQRVSGHHVPHSTTCLLTGNVATLASNHHQLMLPTEKADVICIAREARHLVSDGNELRRDSLKDAMDVEVVYYDHTNSLCFQPDIVCGHEGTITYLETLMHECLILGDKSLTCEP